LNGKEKLTIALHFSGKYRRSGKKDKGNLLSQVSEITGYSRKHLMEILAKPPKKKRVIYRPRLSNYLPVVKKLKEIWVTSNYACGKRLIPIVPVYLDRLTAFKELTLTKREKKLLLAMSPATMDRLLAHDRKRINLKGRSRTKPGTLLKHQIPIRTWADWDNAKPGFLEIDSVHHCGNSLFGEYIFTLDTVDVSTGWNECQAHLGRSEYRTVSALEEIRSKLPFPLLGIDFDSGGEFVNYHLIRYADRNKISYTRSREAIKNDQAYIEQQNYSVVRRYIGYKRLDTPEQLEILNQLYRKLSDYQNFFQPVMRLKTKIRDGAKVTRKYGKPKTAYQRILERKDISKETKGKLTARFLKLNPRKLILEITALGIKLTQK